MSYTEKRTVEVCQGCGTQYDGFLDAVFNAPSTCGPFEQRTVKMEADQDE